MIDGLYEMAHHHFDGSGTIAGPRHLTASGADQRACLHRQAVKQVQPRAKEPLPQHWIKQLYAQTKEI